MNPNSNSPVGVTAVPAAVSAQPGTPTAPNIGGSSAPQPSSSGLPQLRFKPAAVKKGRKSSVPSL